MVTAHSDKDTEPTQVLSVPPPPPTPTSPIIWEHVMLENCNHWNTEELVTSKNGTRFTQQNKAIPGLQFIIGKRIKCTTNAIHTSQHANQQLNSCAMMLTNIQYMETVETRENSSCASQILTTERLNQGNC